MSITLTNALFQSAHTVVADGQIKNIIDISVHDDGTLSHLESDARLNVLNFGNRGDNCVTELQFFLPTELQTGYNTYFLADLASGIYIQECTPVAASGSVSAHMSAWIEDEITFSNYNVNLNCLFVAIEGSAASGNNITEETEIFVTDEFYGLVKQNFLTSGWHLGTITSNDLITSENTIIQESLPETPNPTTYTPMTWVNDETPVNAANMNNIMWGIDEKIACYTAASDATLGDLLSYSGKPFILNWNNHYYYSQIVEKTGSLCQFYFIDSLTNDNFASSSVNRSVSLSQTLQKSSSSYKGGVDLLFVGDIVGTFNCHIPTLTQTYKQLRVTGYVKDGSNDDYQVSCLLSLSILNHSTITRKFVMYGWNDPLVVYFYKPVNGNLCWNRGEAGDNFYVTMIEGIR